MTIRFGRGYVREGQDWSEEMRAPTRLGEPTTTVRLASADGAEARPWADGVRHAVRWQLSQVTVARRLLAGGDPEEADLVSTLERSQPFVGDDVCTIVLRDHGDGFWTGRGTAERGPGRRQATMSVGVRYSRLRGLEITGGA
jgi:CRISPR-associated endonuclease/helicase Cas3